RVTSASLLSLPSGSAIMPNTRGEWWNGRHRRLKISRSVRGVRVRIPPHPEDRKPTDHGPWAFEFHHSHFLNIAWVRSPRDRMYAIRSRISSSLNVSSNPAGIIDTFDGFIDAMLLRFTFTVEPGSSMLVFTLPLSAFRFTIRPTITRSSRVRISTAAYWSLISLLGSMIDSSRSRGLNRPTAPVRSGP